MPSGLDFFRARYYGAALGRFTSTDPLTGHPGDPQSWNAYVYALNNPLLYSDPNGLKYRICQKGSADSKETNCTDDVSDDEFNALKDQSKGTQIFSGEWWVHASRLFARLPEPLFYGSGYPGTV